MGANHQTTRARQKALVEFRELCATEVQPDGSIGRPCWLCKQAIDYDAAADDFRNRDRFQRDHIKPVSTHPELYDDPANAAASHAGCNGAKGDREARPSLGTPSQAWT